MQGPGDFTADRRLIAITVVALVVGGACAVVAAGLLALISFFTRLFFLEPLSFAPASPAAHALGGWLPLVPALGGLIVGLMARYGSDRIRGHGIPEAIEAILIGRSRLSPKVAILKPLSSAISIGSGGPFGAEGPIIMTGGACGSIVAQLFHLSAAERKTLLVAGAAGGMSATFGTPLAAVFLAVELLLFEWKPRSLVPVAIASAAAAALRPWLLGAGPLFPIAPHPEPRVIVLAGCVALGLAVGLASAGLTRAVYAAEDLFQRLPIHWMWWPVFGGLIVGAVGLAQPRVLGVGYDVLRDLLAGRLDAGAIAPLAIGKAAAWSLALGSGTSGGVLAPLLLMGGCLGALGSHVLPGGAPPLWALLGMAAMLAGTMRSPLTAVVFAIELTHDLSALLPLLVVCAVAHAFTVLVMPRSILTEKVARRGHHITREYGVDPLDALRVGDVATRAVVHVPATLPAAELETRFFGRDADHRHQGYPVLDQRGRLVGVITRSALMDLPPPGEMDGIYVASLVDRAPVVAFADETCRAAAERMARYGVGRLPVVSREGERRLEGIVTRSDLLKARVHAVGLEQERERILRLPGDRMWGAPGG